MSIRKLKLLPLCVFLVTVIGRGDAVPETAAFASAGEHTIRVRILSKPMRLYREGGGAPAPVFLFPEGTRLDDRSGAGSISVRRAEVRTEGDGWTLATDAGDLNGPFEGMMNTPGPDRSFEVVIGSERRRYPLPLEVRNRAGEMEFIITERLTRYARDAARAEYGPLPPGTDEAFEALALLVAARYTSTGRSGTHRGYDACDLAHCVVYRGLSAGAGEPEPPWRIDPRSFACGAHFHAECGGRTLGARVFGPGGGACAGVRDRLVETGTDLCGKAGSAWSARLRAKDLYDILLGKRRDTSSPLAISVDDKARRVLVRAGTSDRAYPAEDFRLRVNRRMGWSFLKSNDYRIGTTRDRGETVFVFTGTGSGHGAGLCQKGALELSRRGFSRYEILAHYFPGIRFIAAESASAAPPPELSYAVFDPDSGALINASHREIENRELPTGSIFKLIVALYCAAERPDLFDSCRYNCTGRAAAPLPDRCWTPAGHGELGMSGALSHSCNLYFASLCRSIDEISFRRFCGSLEAAGVRIDLPRTGGTRGFSRLLCGLDYRQRLSVRGFIALARLVSPGEDAPLHLSISSERRAVIARALIETMVTGTVGSEIAGAPSSSPEKNGRPLGKTATVLSGSNRLTGYGLFLGGDGERGIIVVLQGGSGTQAGRWALRLLGRDAADLMEKK